MAHYLDTAQREDIARLRERFTGRTEWPTWLLLLGVYAAWPTLVLVSPSLGVWPTTSLMILLTVLWMSLQHELIHGHPTRWSWLNKCLGYAPLAVWYPYTLYRDTHMQHHRDEHLTVPGMDPESRYLSQLRWAQTAAPMRLLRWLDKTPPGRLVFGVPLALGSLLIGESRRLWHGERQAWAMWATHGFFLVLMFAFIEHYSAFSSVHYLLLVSVPALAISMVRSYYEHRPAEHSHQRTAINEASWPWRWLFLNLNLHLVHHDLPGLAWYHIPIVYREGRAQWVARSGGFLVPGYGELFRRHSFSPIDSPQHPHV
ncbi:fatty acid desaturase [Pseudomonas sp. GD03842]|uniref:fatty acid desaturase n=1 Tax=Pseudomonas sp. GD03842 TaxID=2975385 RepID=UPI00244A9535|nr:fatty acid desaturase [Pseudomonas sp. GD03842]MDH0749649.1 fatty acid desaturase [Pseudomonas sp. GD03842]